MGLLGMLMISGMLMGMSGVHESQSEGAEMHLKLTVQQEENNGREIYTGREEIVIAAEVDGNSVRPEGEGVKEILCQATDSTGYSQNERWEISGRDNILYSPDLALFADGEVCFEFSAVDREGNITEEQKLVLKKDSTRPVITGHFDTIGQKKEKYYSDTCHLYLSVKDENFDFSCRPVVTSEDSSDYTFSGWQKNGNKAEGVLTFSEEGVYQVAFSCMDLAGNQSETMIVPEFIIDRTAPVVSVQFDDTEACNETYYNKGRKAQITVKERWFRPEDGKITVVAKEQEREVTLADWKKTDAGYQAELQFQDEGTNALSISWTDAAGNQAADYHSGSFIIDTTVPEIVIRGVENESSNNGKVAPTIEVHDVNINEGEIKIVVEELTGKKAALPHMDEQKTEDGAVQVALSDFSEDMDGIYKLSVSVLDLAGNQGEKSVFFSVNRKGSYYAFGQETEKLFQKVYIRQPEKVVIYEKNVDWLTDASVILSCNGDLHELKEKTDYVVSAAGNERTGKEYTYTIDEKCFAEEGTYMIYIDSRDRASNYSSIEKNGQKIEFILDKTAPKISVINLEEQQYYHETSHNFQVTVDDNTALSEVRYYLDGKLEEQFSAEDIEEMEGLLELQTKASDEYQKIQIIAEDKAGNITDSGEWHVLVNTSGRTRKPNKGLEMQNDSGSNVSDADLKEESVGRKRKPLLIAGAVCMGVIGGCICYGYQRKRKSVSGNCPILTIEDKSGDNGSDNLCYPESMPYTCDTKDMAENKCQRKNQDNITHT